MQEPSGRYNPGGPQEPPIDQSAIRRLRTLARFAFGWAAVIVLRLLYLQIFQLRRLFAAGSGTAGEGA
jgi:hypothetical protein